VLDGNVVVLQPLGLVLGLEQEPVHPLGDVDPAGREADREDDRRDKPQDQREPEGDEPRAAGHAVNSQRNFV